MTELQGQQGGDDTVYDPAITRKVGAFLIVAALVLVAIIAWASVNFHRADAGVKQWHIWSERCDEIQQLNARRVKQKLEGYFEGCPEGPRNEAVTINR